MKRLILIATIVSLCCGCSNLKRLDAYYLPDLNLYVGMNVSQQNVTLFLSESKDSLRELPRHKLDYLQIPISENILPISYYTFFISKENKDTLWFKSGVKTNDVRINMARIPSLYEIYEKEQWTTEKSIRPTFPLNKYYSLQVWRSGRKYSLHVQNNAVEVVPVDLKSD